MLTVGIVGLGLTGSAIARYLLEHRPDMQIVMAGAGPDSRKSGVDLGIQLGLPITGVSIVAAEDIPAELLRTRPKVIIDFSCPESTLSLLHHYARVGCGVVAGTTGFSESQLKQLQRAPGTQRFGLMYAPNITRGVTVLMLLSKLAARYLPGYDIEVIERHHRRKKDSPSGTAAKIAAQLHDARGDAGETVQGREGLSPREESEIGVHAVRGGGIVGVHEVLFAGDHDEVVITHRSESRLAFAAGAADAAAWVSRRRGYYTLEDMIMSEEVEELISEPLDAPEATPMRTKIAV